MVLSHSSQKKMELPECLGSYGEQLLVGVNTFQAGRQAGRLLSILILAHLVALFGRYIAAEVF